MRDTQSDSKYRNSVATIAGIASLRADTEYARTGRTRPTLVKEAGLRVLLQVVRAGSGLLEHHAPTRIPVFVLERDLHFTAFGETISLRPGDLLTLPPREPHSVSAIQDSAFLLTLASAEKENPPAPERKS